jgi:polysaccharide biosynthesis/export protein
MKLFWRLSDWGLFAATLLFATVMFTGCASDSNGPIFSDNPQPPVMTGLSGENAAPAGRDADRFHVGDTVIVDFSGLSDPNSMPEINETIKEDGTISLPFIGNVVAAGKTPGQLQTAIQNAYVPKYYLHLTVTVKSQARVYYVGGQVTKPGVQEYLGQTTVTKAIQAAGDFTDFANKSKVWLIRANGQRIKVDCKKALQDPSQDPAVYPGDQIQVPRRYF